jgi:hypothetical protein
MIFSSGIWMRFDRGFVAPDNVAQCVATVYKPFIHKSQPFLSNQGTIRWLPNRFNIFPSTRFQIAIKPVFDGNAFSSEIWGIRRLRAFLILNLELCIKILFINNPILAVTFDLDFMIFGGKPSFSRSRCNRFQTVAGFEPITCAICELLNPNEYPL